MFCPNCGAQIPDGSKFCTSCGKSTVIPVQSVQQPVQQPAPIVPQQKKPRKPWYKRWWIWFLMALGTLQIFVIVSAAVSPDSKTEKSSSDLSKISIVETEVEEESSAVTEAPATEAPTEAPTETPEISEQDFKDSCEAIDYDTLARNPDKYKGNNYVFTGEVVQVAEPSGLFSGDTVTLRINVTETVYEYIDESSWTDTIYATVEIPEGEDRILEDDILTFWGTCDGMYTYTAVLGNSVSVPKIDIKYYEIRS